MMNAESLIAIENFDVCITEQEDDFTSSLGLC